MFGLRLGEHPQAIVTPKVNPLTVELMKGLRISPEQTVITRGSSYENASNLPKNYVSSILSAFEGTRLHRQEVFGELLEDVDGALWSYSLLDECRVDKAPELMRTVVAIDPAVSVSESSNETGIIVVGKGVDNHAYVLADASGKYTPTEWAWHAIRLKRDHHADAIIVESNQGGLMVEETLRTLDPLVRVVRVHASSNKAERASPVFSLYEQHKVHHVGSGLKALEDQLVTFVPGAAGGADDKVDALVWGMHELLVGDQQLGYSMYNDRNMVTWNRVLGRWATALSASPKCAAGRSDFHFPRTTKPQFNWAFALYFTIGLGVCFAQGG